MIGRLQSICLLDAAICLDNYQAGGRQSHGLAFRHSAQKQMYEFLKKPDPGFSGWRTVPAVEDHH